MNSHGLSQLATWRGRLVNDMTHEELLEAFKELAVMYVILERSNLQTHVRHREYIERSASSETE